MAEFFIDSTYKPKGDQPNAINALVAGLNNSEKYQTLLGVTGSGKTFTMANVIEEVQKPTLIMSHNKTLAAQLYGEFKQLFPNNAVEYFISYYDYYQPEAYLPVTDTFIEKESSVNEEIDKLRLKATSSLMSREDVIVISSVSCIYGIGSPEEYKRGTVKLSKNDSIDTRKFIRSLIDIHYVRNDKVLERGNVRFRGDLIEIFPAYEDNCIRIDLFGNQVEEIIIFDYLTGEIKDRLDTIIVFPAKHFVTDKETTLKVVDEIREELEERTTFLRDNQKLLEAQRIEQRTNFDIEMMIELGYCSGIENYSRYFSGRSPGEQPNTLIDFFPSDFLTILDESHVTLPQIQGMYNGDRSRKETLVEHGFRLPSALDNRPLKIDEFHDSQNQVIFTSATPSDRELKLCQGVVVEQIIRPTGLLDPIVSVHNTNGQIEHLISEIKIRSKINERILVTTLTKKMSEDLTDYLANLEIRVKYLHSEIKTLERVQIIRDLRTGEFDVLVGINLLREGLDIPEVSLVAILDADKEGFLRNFTSLIQTCGRAARNVTGTVIMYADTNTKSMKNTIDETTRRRKKQILYNEEHGITPKTIMKSVPEQEIVLDESKLKSIHDLRNDVIDLDAQMKKYSEELDFEQAIACRDRIKRLEKEIEYRNDR